MYVQYQEDVVYVQGKENEFHLFQLRIYKLMVHPLSLPRVTLLYLTSRRFTLP